MTLTPGLNIFVVGLVSHFAFEGPTFFIKATTQSGYFSQLSSIPARFCVFKAEILNRFYSSGPAIMLAAR